MNQQDLEKMIKDIISTLNEPQEEKCNCENKNVSGDRMTYENYPLGEKSAEKIKTPTGKSPNELTLEAVMNNEITAEDVRITPETLEMQAQVAESMGRDVFAANLRRAAELIAIPDDRILEIYNALRPYKSTKEELMEIVKELEEKYNCTVTANLVREACEVGEKRGRLRKS